MTRECSDRKRGNDFIPKEDLFRLDIRSKRFFTMRVVKHWKRLPRGTVDGPFLEIGKVSLDWGSEQPLMSLLTAVEDVSAHCKGVGRDCLYRCLPNPKIPRFYRKRK